MKDYKGVFPRKKLLFGVNFQPGSCADPLSHFGDNALFDIYGSNLLPDLRQFPEE